MSPDHALGLFLVDLAALIVLSRLLGGLLSRLGQPSVLGEILAGILIGPSLLGAVAPDLVSALFPAEAMTLLLAVGNLGLVLFVFLIGLEIDQPTVRERVGQVAKISTGSFLLPFAGGALVAVPLASTQPGGGVESQLAFTLFVGTAFSVTAFPVLARILTDRGLERSTLGTMSLAAAGVLDLVGWILLAAALAVAAGDGAGGVLSTILGFLAVAVAVRKAVAPLLLGGLRRFGGEGPVTRFALLSAAVVVCAGATQLIGLHSVIGPLLLGTALPRERLEAVFGSVRAELSPVANGVLLPVYFAIAGMSVDVSAFGSGDVLQLATLLGLATATKIVGTVLGARWAGLGWREGLPLGVLMNTRGLMEVVVLNIGLSAGLLDLTLYSELMLVALISTVMTGPLIERLRTRSGGRLWREIGQRRGRPTALEREPETLPQHSI